MSVIRMSVQEWISIKDNPRQRDTIKRARTASRKHLREYCDVHKFVYAACKDGKIVCKLDGHTRAYLWQAGDLELPPDGQVCVCLIDVSDISEAMTIYEQLDSQPSVKKSSDTIFGACRECGFSLHSPLLRSCTFTTQLKMATTGNRFAGNIYEMIPKWKQDLMALDSLALTSKYAMLIAAMLVSIRRDGIVKAGDFWKRLDNDEGSKTSAGYDGVQCLRSVIDTRRGTRRGDKRGWNNLGGWHNLMIISGMAWRAYEMFLSGRRSSKASLNGVNFTKVVTSVVVDNFQESK